MINEWINSNHRPPVLRPGMIPLPRSARQLPEAGHPFRRRMHPVRHTHRVCPVRAQKLQ